MSREPLMDDLSKMFGNAMQNIGVLKQEVENMVKGQLQFALQKMDIPTREELDSLRGLLDKINKNQQDILLRLESLEKAAIPPAQQPKRKKGEE